MIAVMGPEAAVNAVHYNRLQSLPEAERAAETERLRREYREDVDIARLASELVVDAVVPPVGLREGIAARLRAARGGGAAPAGKGRGVPPVGAAPGPARRWGHQRGVRRPGDARARPSSPTPKSAAAVGSGTSSVATWPAPLLENAVRNS